MRWEVSGLRDAPDVAAEALQSLQRIAELTFVHVNPNTGRVLVRYRQELSELELTTKVQQALRSGQAAALAKAEHYASLNREQRKQSAARLANAIGAGIGVLVAAPLCIPAIGASLFLTVATAVSASLATHAVLTVLDEQRSSRAAEDEQRKRTLRRLLDDMQPYRNVTGLVVLCGSMTALFWLSQFGVVGLTVDLVTGRRRSRLPGLNGSPGQILLIMGGATLAITGLQALCEYGGQLLWRNLSQSLQHRLRTRAHARVLSLSSDELDARRPGYLLSVLTEDVAQLEVFFGAAWDLIRMVSAVAVIGSTFFALAPHVGWLAMLAIPAGLRISALLQKRSDPLQRSVAEQAGVLSGELAGSLDGISTIKIFAAEQGERARIHAASGAFRATSSATTDALAAFAPTLEFMGGVAVQMLRGGLLSAGSRMTPGAYTSLAMLTGQLFGPLTELGRVLETSQRALASCERIYGLLDAPGEQLSGGTPIERARVRGEIEFERVSFGYDAEHPVLRDLSLRVAPGQVTVLVGPTGSGKSTLVKLLLRLHAPQRGRIMFDGRDISELAVQDWRRTVGVVSQDVFLFYGSIRSNIALGMPDADQDAIERAAELAGVHEFAARLPLGYETLVGERGYRLSGGQRQRIALARALLHTPPVLILDEATSQVDNKTEAEIYASLMRAARGRTVLVIAHRLSVVRYASAIRVLERGHVSEQGTHDDLVQRNGLYAALWRLQAGEAEASSSSPLSS